MADSDTLILVDREDNEIGFAPKLESASWQRKPPRIFLLIFDRQGDCCYKTRRKQNAVGRLLGNVPFSHRKGRKLMMPRIDG